ncbi:hypothetical protein ABZ802_05570 [Streptomyces sp. NPDC047737]
MLNTTLDELERQRTPQLRPFVNCGGGSVTPPTMITTEVDTMVVMTKGWR